MAAAPRRSADRALLRDRPARSTAVKRARVLTADEVAALIESAGPRDAALIALMSAGAMRVGETTLLTWADVDGCDLAIPGGITLAIPGGITKTRHGRSLTLPPAACRLLLQWRALCPTTKKGWIFPGLRGQPLSIRGAQTAISKLAAAVGIAGVSSHSFRRSELTAAHQSGLSLREVAQISGHQSLAALEKYLDQDAARSAAEGARGLLLGNLR